MFFPTGKLYYFFYLFILPSALFYLSFLKFAQMVRKFQVLILVHWLKCKPCGLSLLYRYCTICHLSYVFYIMRLFILPLNLPNIIVGGVQVEYSICCPFLLPVRVTVVKIKNVGNFPTIIRNFSVFVFPPMKNRDIWPHLL